MLNADGAVVVGVRCAWKKIRELSFILNFKEASFKLKSKAYGSCVLRCMMYGSETWPMKKWHESMLERTEIRKGRWMCSTALREKKSSAELRDWMGIEAIGAFLKRNRLRWFGHVGRIGCIWR